jgi:hypothetical protein
MKIQRLSKYLRFADGNRLIFFCPGCNAPHGLTYGSGSGDRWYWNGDIENPTFEPSILIQHNEYGPRKEPLICHSKISDGIIQFLMNVHTHWQVKLFL